MANPPPAIPDDGEHDDLAALDFSVAEPVGETDLGAILGDYPAHDDKPGDDLSATGPDPYGAADPMPTFTVANPPGTVTVTTYLDGRVRHVDLSPKAAELPEAVLADEIVVIAGLATQDARSAQYTFMLDGMRDQGHDNVTTRDFLTRDLHLPTPEQAQAARAELFTTRYAGDE